MDNLIPLYQKRLALQGSVFKLTLLFLCFFHTVGNAAEPAFDETLNLFSIPGQSERTMMCFHGYGASYKVAQNLKDLGCIDVTLVSFNFPDHDLKKREWDPEKATLGTIDELLCAFSVLKQVVLDQNLDLIDLYGDSAGGGALINILALLNHSTRYDPLLEDMGIGSAEKKKLLSAIQKGIVILDTPLKSPEEVLDKSGLSSHFKGGIRALEKIAGNYRENGFRPIDSVRLLDGLSLDILLHFQEDDELLSNRDDSIYIERLEEANRLGRVTVIIGNDGGHTKPHFSLWNYYAKKMESLLLTHKNPLDTDMPDHVFVVSEWLPKEGCEQELWDHFKKLMALTLENESGCIRAHATRQIPHPGSPGTSKYKIILLQEYVDVKAFDMHCKADYVTRLFKQCVEDKETSIVEEWCCRLFSEGA